VLRSPSHGLYSEVAELDLAAQFSGYTKRNCAKRPKNDLPVRNPRDALMSLYARYARVEDLPRILELYNACISVAPSTGDSETALVAEELEWFTGHQSGKRPLWVLEENALIVGWSALSSFRDEPIFARTAEVSIYIAPERQRRGFGRCLLERVMESCPALDIDTLLGFVAAHNLPSNRLFEGLGFSRWGLLPGVALMDGARRDLVIFGKSDFGR
jgi:L-amino acid N-acyltransferase YncA